MPVEELARRVRDAAYLEGDFLLRSGRRSTFYLDKYRFETQPDLLRDLGAALAERIRAVEPDAVRIAGPELGAVALAASASMASGLPFVIVRGAAKAYGTGNRLEGVAEPGERIAWSRTSSRAAARPWRPSRRCARRGSSARPSSASWTAEKAAPRPWLRPACGCTHCSTRLVLRLGQPWP